MFMHVYVVLGSKVTYLLLEDECGDESHGLKEQQHTQNTQTLQPDLAL